jgi:hypothetical protein
MIAAGRAALSTAAGEGPQFLIRCGDKVFITPPAWEYDLADPELGSLAGASGPVLEALRLDGDANLILAGTATHPPPPPQPHPKPEMA